MTIKIIHALIVQHRANKRYDAMIEASKAKVAETTLVPGVVQIYA